MSGRHTTLKPLVTALLQDAAALHRTGQLAAAEDIYCKILKKDPRNPDALHLLGLVVAQRGDAPGGRALVEKALAVRDDFPDAHINAAVMASQASDWPRAEHHARQAVVHRPNLDTHRTLASILLAQGRRDDAIAVLRAASEREPGNVEARAAHGRALRLADDMHMLLSVAQGGLALAPDHPTLHLLCAEAYFGLEQFQDGWREYLHRFRALEARVADKGYSLPFWSGEDLSERTILVWAEQGPGDEVMYANMYADVIARARRCIIQCSPRLMPLMRRSFPGAEHVDRDLTTGELAGIDYQCPAGNLGEWLRPRPDTFPDHQGYLRADPQTREALRARYLEGAAGQLLVGIAWRSAGVTEAAEKSVNILDWGPILQVPHVKFVNLQYGDCAQELAEVARGFKVGVIDDRSIDSFRDLDAYAAQVAAMDMVVSSSNTAAHFAGALGIPTLCMLPESLGRGRRWYWFSRDGRSLWYPSTRLFIKSEPGQWLHVIRDAGLALLDAVTLRGVSPVPYLRSMAKAFADMGRPADAEVLYRHMTRTTPHVAEGYYFVAELKKKALDAEGAFENLDRALAADPAFWHAHNSKGSLLAALNRFSEAIDVYRAGLRQNEASPELHNNLGKALAWLGRCHEARAHYERALELAPPGSYAANAIALNYAGALNDSGESSRALAALGALIDEQPSHVDAHYNRAQILLSMERYDEGWREFAWRLKRPEANVRPEAFPHIKPWAGEPLSGKKILIWTEQGIGDEILVATMIPDAIAAARKVVVLCSKRLVPLFRRSFPTAHVDERTEPLPRSALARDFDFQMSLSDLGLAFRTSSDSFPKRRSTLVADEARRKILRARYAGIRPGNVLVGLSWSSEKNHEIGWLKGNRLEAWQPILQTPDVTFVNLQYGDQSETLARVREQAGIDVTWDRSIDPLKDMDGFAAQVAAMDAVVSVSNTTVHTAGALGIPVNVMLGHGRGRLWYWFQQGSDSPWYPSARLFRSGPDGWAETIGRCAQDLRARVSAMKASGTA